MRRAQSTHICAWVRYDIRRVDIDEKPVNTHKSMVYRQTPIFYRPV
jgi:hypothetical protein